MAFDLDIEDAFIHTDPTLIGFDDGALRVARVGAIGAYVQLGADACGRLQRDANS